MPPRMRLYRDGVRIPLDAVQFRSPSFLLNTPRLLSYLGEGATLIIDSVEQTNPHLRLFASNVQSRLKAPVNVNLYAAWRQSSGFPIHRDPQENFILQIAGRKQWKVWSQEVAELEALSRVNPRWDGVLEQGSLLYIPKGWWHWACPIGEPSLHLTVSVVPLMFRDFLAWLSQEIGSWQGISSPIMLRAGADHNSSLLNDFFDTIRSRCTAASLDDYLKQQPWNDPPYPNLNLPSLTDVLNGRSH